jgi:hypothetical protein
VVLAWESIVDDVEEGRVNSDLLQKKQAEKELSSARDVLPRAVRECYRWLLCPSQNAATDPKAHIEAFPLNASGASLGSELERVCLDNELVIGTWSAIHLRAKMTELYWKDGKSSASAMGFWEDTLRYLYLPRLKDREVLAQAIRTGAASKDFFGTAYGFSGSSFEGFQFGTGTIQLDDTLILIEPETAKSIDDANRRKVEPKPSRTAATRRGRPPLLLQPPNLNPEPSRACSTTLRKLRRRRLRCASLISRTRSSARSLAIPVPACGSPSRLQQSSLMALPIISGAPSPKTRAVSGSRQPIWNREAPRCPDPRFAVQRSRTVRGRLTNFAAVFSCKTNYPIKITSAAQ